MGFNWSPGWTLLLAAFGLFISFFAIWATHTYFRQKSTPIKSELPQISYQRPDPVLRHSLYNCSKFDITNPRDSKSSLVLNDNRYSAPPPAYSRPPSFISSTIHPRESSLSLNSLRQSIYGDDTSFEGPRNSIATSIIPSRTSTPATSRRQSMVGSVYNDSGPSLAVLRHSIYGDSNPVFTNPRSSSSSLPTRHMDQRLSSSDLSIRGQQASSSLTDLRRSLYAEDSQMRPHSSNQGVFPLSRTSSSSIRNSCPEFMPTERSSSLASVPIAAPAPNSVISNSAIRRPKNSNEKQPSRLISVDTEYLLRPKTSNTPRKASRAEIMYRPKTNEPANLELDYLVRPNFARPLSMIELQSQGPKSFQTECAQPARVYTPSAPGRRVSRPVELNPQDDEFVKWAQSLSLLKEDSTDYLPPIDTGDFVCFSDSVLPGTAL